MPRCNTTRSDRTLIEGKRQVPRELHPLHRACAADFPAAAATSIPDAPCAKPLQDRCAREPCARTAIAAEAARRARAANAQAREAQSPRDRTLAARPRTLVRSLLSPRRVQAAPRKPASADPVRRPLPCAGARGHRADPGAAFFAPDLRQPQMRTLVVPLPQSIQIRSLRGFLRARELVASLRIQSQVRETARLVPRVQAQALREPGEARRRAASMPLPPSSSNPLGEIAAPQSHTNFLLPLCDRLSLRSRRVPTRPFRRACA